ncbi:MAG: hemerythrin domain-containing protein [Chlamydiales bacterium]|nr:hemerythrin domain-containing protein [Chlamydiales bacterium]
MRYQFYREHKFVSASLNDVERLIAKTDFRETKATEEAKSAFNGLTSMLQGHADYENSRLHTLLEKKGSQVHKHAEEDHAHQDGQLSELHGLFEKISAAQSNEQKIALGYQLYLTFRKFVSDNLAHLHEEETILLPELQRLYTDEELKQVENESYSVMTVDQLVEMLQHLFPHMNPADHEAFLADIRDLQPEKYPAVMQKIKSTF